MKILVVTQYFWPEEFRINDICKELEKEGHTVEVLTGLPNYPKGSFFGGYSIKGPYKDKYDGMKVMRFPVIPRGNGSSVKMILNYLSFMIVGLIRMIPLLFKSYDRVFMFQTSPITAAIPALFYSKVRRKKSCIYIQDIWPETFYTIVPIKNKTAKKIFKGVCNSIYRAFDTILVSSRGFKDILIKSDISEEKILYFPQWAEDLYSQKVEVEKNEDFVVTFAGNIGKAQSVETIVEAARLCKERKEIKWHIVGDGSEWENVKKLVEEYDLGETVKLFGRRPVTEMPKFFAESDALIVTLKEEGILSITLPAKVQSYMASAKPIIAAVTGEGSRVIEEAECGFTGRAGDYNALYENVIKLYDMDKESRTELGENGAEFFKNNYTKEILMKQLQKVL